MSIYQWINLETRHLDYTDPLTKGQVSFLQSSLKKWYSRLENFLQKLEIFGSVNEKPADSKGPKQSKTIPHIATNFQQDQHYHPRRLIQKTFLSKCCRFGLPYTLKLFDKFNLLILLYFLNFHHQNLSTFQTIYKNIKHITLFFL